MKSLLKEYISLVVEDKRKSNPGLWHNIHKRRKQGKKKLKPGDENYPETLDIDENEEIEEKESEKKPLNKPIRTSDGNKKFKVYVKDPKTKNVKTVRFGDPNMEIKRDDPERRKSFRARHNCDNPGPKTKARYWSCYQWRKGSKVKG